MITTFDFFQPGQVGSELRLGRKRRTINPLQHGIAFISAPIGACCAQQFERSHMAESRQVWSSAKIDKISLRIAEIGSPSGKL